MKEASVSKKTPTEPTVSLTLFVAVLVSWTVITTGFLVWCRLRVQRMKATSKCESKL